MMRLLACDPGNEQSAFVLFDSIKFVPVGKWLLPNDQCRARMGDIDADHLVIELTPLYTLKTTGGHAYTPNQLALTAFESGRFAERWMMLSGNESTMFSRMDVKKHLLGRANGNDSQIRNAILDHYGGTRKSAVGIKAKPGPLYGFRADMYAALAVAICYIETNDLKAKQQSPF